MTSLDERQRASLLDRLFRRIGKLDDQSLIQLESMTRAAESGSPVQFTPTPHSSTSSAAKPAPNPDQVSRRYFLVSLFAGGILAASAGGAAALALQDESVRNWLQEQGWIPTSTALPTTPTPTVGPSAIPTLPAEMVAQINSLKAQVTSLTAERDVLRQQVNSLTGQNATLQDNNTLINDVLKLYKQLDDINIDQVIASALSALGIPVLAVETVRQALAAGIVLAVQAIQSVETQMPLIAAGLDWLDAQVSTLSNTLHQLTLTLQIAGNTPTGKAITDLVNSVLDLLPFGAGQNIKQGLVLMGDLVSKLPDLVDNVNTRLIEPARAWIVSGNTGGLFDLLISPIRQQVLTPAQQIVANAENLNQVYNKQLAQPAQSALDQRAKIRAEILKKAGALPA